jgi:hypothetical protein
MDPNPGLTGTWGHLSLAGGRTWALTSAVATTVPPPVATVSGVYRHHSSDVRGRLKSTGCTASSTVVPAAPVLRFRQFTDTSMQSSVVIEMVVGGVAEKVTMPGALVVADGVTADSRYGTQHLNPTVLHAETKVTGAWNIVVVADGTDGGFALAQADEPSGAVRMVTAATVQATDERGI